MRKVSPNCGGICRDKLWRFWKSKCDEIRGDLLWRYRVAFHADYDQHFEYELEKFAKKLTDEVEEALLRKPFVLVVEDYTKINRIIYLECYIRTCKFDSITNFAQILPLVVIYKNYVKIIN